jgi:hypothetical protein
MLRPYAAITMQHAAVRHAAITMGHAAVQARWRDGGAQHWRDMGRRAICGGPMLRPYAAITMRHAAVRHAAITMGHAAVQGRRP